MLGIMFAASAAFASPTSNVDFATMNKADVEVLFGNGSANVVALSKNEMKTTEGEFFAPVIWALTFGWASTTYLNTLSYTGWTYSSWPNQKQTYHNYGSESLNYYDNYYKNTYTDYNSGGSYYGDSSYVYGSGYTGSAYQ